MTEDEAIAKVVKWFIGELGYKEGANNWNKYAALPGVQQMLALGAQAQNQPWCVTVQVAADEECFGAETAVKIERSSMHNVAAYVSGFVAGFQQHQTPKLGDLVVYTNFSHIGRVVSLSPLKFIDGNYSDGVNYHWGTSDVVGYYTPDWHYATTGSSEDPDADQEEELETNSFSVGDWVEVKTGSRDYSGMRALNSLVFTGGPWEIKYLNGDRAVLDANQSGTHHIMTPVSTANLTKVVIEETATTTSSEITNNSACAEIAQVDSVPEVSAFTSSTTSTTSTATSYGVQGSIAAQIQQAAESGPVILNNTATTTHTFGGRRKNVTEE